MNKLLVIEDDDFAYRVINLQLKDIGYLNEHILRCVQLSDMVNINSEEIGVILTDLTLPDSCSKSTFKRVKEKFPFKPIVVLTGSAEIEVAIDTIQQGAQDYLVKGEFNHKILEKAIQYAIERNRILDAILAEKQNLRTIINNTDDIIWSVNRNYGISMANDAFWKRIYKITGKRKGDVTILDIDKELLNNWMGFFEKSFEG